MLQFYFLSVLLNLIAGFILIYASDYSGVKNDLESADLSVSEDDFQELSEEEKSTSEKNSDSKKSKKSLSLETFLQDKLFCLVTGVLSVLVSIFLLLSPIKGDVPVIGDLIPVLAGFGAGGALLLDYYSNKSNMELKLPSIIKTVFIDERKYLGIFCILAGVLHFIFPKVLFL